MGLFTTLTLQDAYGRVTTRRWGSTRTTLSDAKSDAAALITLLEAISDIGVVKYTIEDVTQVGDAAQSGANLDVGATITGTMENAIKHAQHVPAIKASLIGAGGVVDIADSDVAAFLASFESAGKFRVSEGNYYTQWDYGFLDK